MISSNKSYLELCVTGFTSQQKNKGAEKHYTKTFYYKVKVFSDTDNETNPRMSKEVIKVKLRRRIFLELK